VAAGNVQADASGDLRPGWMVDWHPGALLRRRAAGVFPVPV